MYIGKFDDVWVVLEILDSSSCAGVACATDASAAASSVTATAGCRVALFDCIPKCSSTPKGPLETGNNADGDTDETPNEEALDEDPGGGLGCPKLGMWISY